VIGSEVLADRVRVDAHPSGVMSLARFVFRACFRNHVRRFSWGGRCRLRRRHATSGPTSAASTPTCASTAKAI